MEKGQWVRAFADAASLHDERLPGTALVEIMGDKRVLIECHRGVTAYSAEKITVKVSFGTISVCGCGMELTVMTREKLVISGRIDSVCLNRRDC